MDAPGKLYLSETRAGPVAGTFLLGSDDLEELEAKEFIFRQGRYEVRIFIQKFDGRFFAYENVCPHARTPLNLMADRFLDATKTRLLCQTHGAQFDPETGYCTLGPCEGAYLRAVAVDIRTDGIYSL